MVKKKLKVIHTSIMLSVGTILNILFPIKCFGCGKKNVFLCSHCQGQLPPPTKQIDLLSATSYQSKIIKKTIWTLKYKKAKLVALPLAKLIYHRLDLNYRSSTSIVIPVPLSKKRLRKRGFNQAKEISRHLSDMTNIKVLDNVLYKDGHTTPQVEMKNKEERLKNLKGAFSVKNTELIKNKTIYLLDDIFTTGATINECRKTLLKAGAKKVIGVVVARG